MHSDFDIWHILLFLSGVITASVVNFVFRKGSDVTIIVTDEKLTKK